MITPCGTIRTRERKGGGGCRRPSLLEGEALKCTAQIPALFSSSLTLHFKSPCCPVQAGFPPLQKPPSWSCISSWICRAEGAKPSLFLLPSPVPYPVLVCAQDTRWVTQPLARWEASQCVHLLFCSSLDKKMLTITERQLQVVWNPNKGDRASL